MLGVGILHHAQLECFDGSEVTGKGTDSIAQKQNCVVEEIKEVKGTVSRYCACTKLIFGQDVAKSKDVRRVREP